MKKQILSVILTLSMVLSLLPTQALVAEGSEGASVASVVQDGFLGNALLWSLDDAGTLTISVNPEATSYTDYDMPDYSVTNQPWDNYAADIRSVVIGDRVTRIGNNAFYGCTNLKAVTFEDVTVTEIGSSAFRSCTSLTDITIPEGVTVIGWEAFGSCSSLTSITLPSTLKTIEDQVFNYSGLQTVTLPENLQKIGTEAFSNTKLSSLTIPASVTDIGEGAFEECRQLTDITVGGGSNYRFEAPALFRLEEGNPVTLLVCLPAVCPNSYEVPATVTRIGNGAFSRCTKLGSLTLPDGLLEIGDSAFTNCNRLQALTIPEQVTSIGANAFLFVDCDIVIPGSVKTLGQSALGGVDCSSITLKEGVEKICNGAIAPFANHSDGSGSNLKTLSLPLSLRELDYASMFSGAFSQDPDVAEIKYAGTAAQWRNNVTVQPGNAAYFEVPFECSGQVAHKIFYDLNGAAGRYNNAPPNGKPATLFDNLDTEVTLTAPTAGKDQLPTTGTSGTYFEYATAPAGGAFQGWLINGRLYRDGDKFSVAGLAEDVTATAIWFEKDIPLTVTLEYQDGTTPSGSISCQKDSAYGEDLPEPTRTGCRFDGWYTAAEGGTKVTSETIVSEGRDHTLYAHWVRQYTVSFDTNGGGAAPADITVETGAAYNALGGWPNAPVREDHTFDGWYTAAEGGTKVTSTDTVTQEQDHTLYAHWTEEAAREFTVIFDANGGTVTTASKQVTQNQLYGELPAPTRTGFRFDGWYTAAEGGSEITAGSSVETTADHTLYAHWTQLYTVTFDANGGVVSTTSKQAAQDQPYGELPVPTRDGYQFDGWYTAAQSGTKIESTTTVELAEDHTLYAHWTKKVVEGGVTVTFDANGGAVTTASKQVTQDQPYGELPVPTRDGYQFGGWYTAKEGGVRIEAASRVEADAGLTLYARWLVDYIPLLSFGFSNSSGDFGYRPGYRIPYARFQMVYGETAQAKIYYENAKPWAGSCGGMAALSGIFYRSDTDLDFRDFRSGPSSTTQPTELSALRPDWRTNRFSTHQWDLSVRALTEGMWMAGYSCLSARGMYNSLTDLWDAVDHFYQTGEYPVYIGVYPAPGEGPGHALVGYRVEEVSDTEGRVYVYDCNAPLSRNEYITLTKDSPNGPYTHFSYWRFDHSLSYSINNGPIPSWLDRVDIDKGNNMIDPTMELLLVNSSQGTVLDSQGAVVAELSDGRFEAKTEGVYPVLAAAEPGDGTPSLLENDINAIWVPVGQYSVLNTDESVSEFKATMVHVDSAATITTSGDAVSFIVNDGGSGEPAVNYVRLGDPNAAYTICLESSADPDNYRELRITGRSMDKAVSFAQADDQLYVNGTPADRATYETRINGDVYPDDIDLEKETYEEYEQREKEPEVPWQNVTADTLQIKTELPEVIANTAIRIQFEPNGGAGTMEPESAVTGMPFAMPACTFTAPVGKTFDRWSIGNADSGDTAETGEFHTFTGDVTIYALWKDSGSGGGDHGGSSGNGGGTSPTYKPQVIQSGGGGGAPSISPSDPKQGDTVTITPKPDEGYEVDKITVLDRDGKPVEVTKKPDGTYTFQQANGKMTIEVTYQPIDQPWNDPFSDVSGGDWYYETVRFVQERRLMNGYGDSRFGPNDDLSRAQFAQILFNKEGRPVVNYQMDFSDVTGEAWYTEAVRWAASQGIVRGYGNGTFGPNDPITREQLAVMLWRYSGSPAASGELNFDDVDEISGHALEALRWAVENGILNGYGDGRLGPQGRATRAQAARMLKNFIEDQESKQQKSLRQM